MIAETMLRRMMPNAGARLDAHLPFIVPALEKGRVTTPDRIAACLAQLAHESGEYRYMHELASGDAYEGRADLGNDQPGDGPRFKGGGPMQVTGKDNYRACGVYLGIDLVAHPERIREPQYATASAVWFWTIGNKKVDLNLLADLGWFKAITRIINGGYNGLSDRRHYWDRNRALLGLPMMDLDEEGSRIAAFQRSHGLFADGAVGPRTLTKLKEAA